MPSKSSGGKRRRSALTGRFVTPTVLHLAQRHSHHRYGGPRRYFRVVIHPDADDFREAATRYAGGDFNGALGCCHPAPIRERYDKATGTWTDVADRHWGSILRFVTGHVHTEVVAHEVTHAALVIYRMDVHPDVRLGTGCHDREETLAYIAGDLMAAASTALHDAGVWS